MNLKWVYFSKLININALLNYIFQGFAGYRIWIFTAVLGNRALQVCKAPSSLIKLVMKFRLHDKGILHLKFDRDKIVNFARTWKHT